MSFIAIDIRLQTCCLCCETIASSIGVDHVIIWLRLMGYNLYCELNIFMPNIVIRVPPGCTNYKGNC
jgi:hypothetical protein